MKIGVTTVTMEIAAMIAGVTGIGIGADSLRDQTDVAVAIVLGTSGPMNVGATEASNYC
jgi:hypothetical protein